MVEVPLPAGGLVAIHQQAGLAAHFAVEILHAKLLAPLRPGSEFIARADEPAIEAKLDIDAEAFAPTLLHLEHAPFRCFGGDHAMRYVARNGPRQFTGQRAGVCRIVEPDIVDLPAKAAQFIGEGAHRGEDEGQLLLVVANVGRLVRDLGHQHDVMRAVAALKRGDGRR